MDDYVEIFNYHNKKILLPFYLEEREHFICKMLDFMVFINRFLNNNEIYCLDECKLSYIKQKLSNCIKQGTDLLDLNITCERSSEIMKDTELKPCPFCGGKAVKIIYWDEEEQNEKAWEHGDIQDEEHYLCVRCYDCDIQFFGGVPISGYELIEAWNRRAEK